MAFCNNQAPCGRDCGRQDDHGGSCDCYGTDCPTCNRPEPTPKPIAARCLMTVFAISLDGKFYRTNHRGHRSGWVSDLKDARLWTKPGPAKAKVTVLADEGDVPELVELVVTEFKVVNQDQRVAAARAKREREEAAQETHRRQQELERAQAELRRAEERVRQLQKGR